MTTLNAKITKLKAQIEIKRVEVVELSDSLALLTTPPKYEIAAGQLPFFEQVRSLMAEHKDDDERQTAFNAAQSVLDNAQSELFALKKELEGLESERDCALAIAEVKQAAAAYNAAAKALLKQGENLRGVSMKCGTVLHRAGRSANIFTTDLDNIAGAVLDALVQAGILRDDSITVVSSLAIALQYSTQSPIVQIQLGNLG